MSSDDKAILWYVGMCLTFVLLLALIRTLDH